MIATADRLVQGGVEELCSRLATTVIIYAMLPIHNAKTLPTQRLKVSVAMAAGQLSR